MEKKKTHKETTRKLSLNGDGSRDGSWDGTWDGSGRNETNGSRRNVTHGDGSNASWDAAWDDAWSSHDGSRAPATYDGWTSPPWDDWASGHETSHVQTSDV